MFQESGSTENWPVLGQLEEDIDNTNYRAQRKMRKERERVWICKSVHHSNMCLLEGETDTEWGCGWPTTTKQVGGRVRN